MVSYNFNSYLNHWTKLRGDQIALADSVKEVTYKELSASIYELRKCILNLGLKRGDIVGVCCPKNIPLITMYLSLMGLGISVVPFPEEFNISYFNKIMKLINPNYLIIRTVDSWLLYDTKNFSTRYQAIKGLPNTKKIIKPINSNHLTEFEEDDLIEENTYFNITSGSTGELKAVRVGSKEIIFNAISVNKRFPIEKKDYYCCFFPPEMHPHELFSRTIIAGAKSLILTTKDIKDFNKYLEKRKVAQIHATPHTYKALINICNKKSLWSETKFLLVGGESSSILLRRNFYEKTGKKLIPVWGSTETTGIVLAAPDDMLLEEEYILGIPIEGYEVEINSQNQEMLIRGKSLLKSYWNNSGKSPITENGFYRTNDSISVNSNNIITYVGRIDSIIKAGGRKILLNQIEKKVKDLQEVEEACLHYSAEDMTIYVYIVLTNNIASITQLKKLLSIELMPNKYRIVILDHMPKLPSGKLDRLSFRHT